MSVSLGFGYILASHTSEWRTIRYPSNWAIWDERVFPHFGWMMMCNDIPNCWAYKGNARNDSAEGLGTHNRGASPQILDLCLYILRFWRLDPLLQSYKPKIASGRDSCWCSSPLRCVPAWMDDVMIPGKVCYVCWSVERCPKHQYLLYIGDFTTQLFR